ncbi:hypothetical protein LXA43DRAFT_990944 [Ganoderma leucocontextum]|nr:hypothetical protein LXA43DRAFT_990944 [Ganoderma leucocontextum]
MFSTTKPVISFIVVLALLQLVSSEPLSSIFGQLCILLSFIHGFGFLLTDMTPPSFDRFASALPPVPFFLAHARISASNAFHGVTTVIAFASTVIRPLYSVTTTILVWTLTHCFVIFLGTSVHIALFVLLRPEAHRCCKCGTGREPEAAPIVVKDHTRSQGTNGISACASQPPNDFCDSDRTSSSATDASMCIDETDAASSWTQDSADFSFDDDRDGGANSTWDSDATSATLLSDSDICNIAARFNHVLVKERFCVADSILCTPQTGCKYQPAMEADNTPDDAIDSSSDLNDTFTPFGGLLSTSFSSTSISAQSPPPSGRSHAASSSCSSSGLSSSPTRVSNTLNSVFSTSFTAVARATSGSRSAPASRHSSFSSNAPLFRPLSLFASSTSSDVSLAFSSPSPSRAPSTYGPLMLLPAGNCSWASSGSSLSDTFFDAPEPVVGLPSSSSHATSNSVFLPPPSLIHSLTNAPTHAPFIPASLSAWHLTEGNPLADDSPSRPLRIFGIPAEELPAHSYSVTPSGDVSAKDEAYLRTALGLHEPASMPRRGFWTSPEGPKVAPQWSRMARVGLPRARGPQTGVRARGDRGAGSVRRGRARVFVDEMGILAHLHLGAGGVCSSRGDGHGTL